MATPHSLDFRQAVVVAHAECGSSAEVAGPFGCSESFVRRMTQRQRETGDLTPRSTARTDDQRAYDDKDERRIRKLIAKRPDLTLAEVAKAIGKPACTGTVCRTLRRLELPRKKSRPTPPSGTGPMSWPSGPRGSGSSPTSA